MARRLGGWIDRETDDMHTATTLCSSFRNWRAKKAGYAGIIILRQEREKGCRCANQCHSDGKESLGAAKHFVGRDASKSIPELRENRVNFLEL